MNQKEILLVYRGAELPVIKELECGFINIATDNDGIIRSWTPFKEFSHQVFNAFPLKIAQVINHPSSITLNTPVNQSQRIYFYGTPDTFPKVSFSQVYDQLLPKNYFKNKIVLVGATFSAGQDFHLTPFTGNNSPFAKMSGVEINANILNMLLNKDQIKTPVILVQLLVSLILLILVFFLFIYYIRLLNPFYSFLILISLFFLSVLLFWTLFNYLIPFTIPILSAFFLYISIHKIKRYYDSLETLAESQIIEQNQKFNLQPFFTQYKITDREKEIILGMLKDYTKAQIGKKLFISFHTVKKHISNIYSKLNIGNREELVALIKKSSKN